MRNNAVAMAVAAARPYMNLGGNLKRIINNLATANAIEKPIAKTRSSGIPKLKKSWKIMLSHVHKVTGISAEISQNRFDTDVIGVMQIVATAAEVKIAIGCLRKPMLF